MMENHEEEYKKKKRKITEDYGRGKQQYRDQSTEKFELQRFKVFALTLLLCSLALTE